MEILTWNIQAGLGVDGTVDLGRIADVVQRLGAPDVICFQEVSRNMQLLESGLPGDQVNALAALFPGYRPFFGPAIERIDAQGGIEAFGNLVLCRLAVAGCSRHLLPRPASPGIFHMRRQATELELEVEGRRLRVVSTHLEYFSHDQRFAQVSRLLDLHRESCANARLPPRESEFGPYAHFSQPVSAIVCGDFNFRVQDPEYALITGELDGQTPKLVDSWRFLYGERAHDPTCGIYDVRQWPEGPHCRDFFFVSEDLAQCVKGLRVDGDTAASDHQPLLLNVDL